MQLDISLIKGWTDQTWNLMKVLRSYWSNPFPNITTGKKEFLYLSNTKLRQSPFSGEPKNYNMLKLKNLL